MIESSENVHYIELSFVGGWGKLKACAHAYCALYGDVYFRVFRLLLEPRLVNHHSISPGQNTADYTNMLEMTVET